MKRLLIISNNVLSETNNNGKTIYSFVNSLDDVLVSQLYLSGEVPRINKFKYFRISDKDILRGLIKRQKRGTSIIADNTNESQDDYSIKNKVGRNKYTLLMRDILWHKKWNSKALVNWLNRVRPDSILFVAGDAVFAYEIAEYIQRRYNARLTVYVTDDYVMPRANETFLEKIRRRKISNSMKEILRVSSCFYTISEPMRRAYYKKYNFNSHLAVNMADDLKNDDFIANNNEIVLTYTGSFYYKRADVLHQLSLALREYNKCNPKKKAKLMLYSNEEPEDSIKKKICVSGVSEYGGSLDPAQLKERLNTSDFLVFVESFDAEYIEKVKYSLSTKIPEYMSVGKPILAIGPIGIGSIDYLKDVSICINDPNEILVNVKNVLDDSEKQKEYGKKSRDKYLTNHNKYTQIELFAENVFGKDDEV